MPTFPFQMTACPALALLPVCALVLNGCASTPPPPGLSIQRSSSAGVTVQSVHLRAIGKGVMVSGVVRRSFGYSSRVQSHLDVDVFGPEGHLQSHVAIKYIPLPIPDSHRMPGRSEYAVELPELPSAGSIIRVSHHPVSLPKCHEPSTPNPSP